MSAHVFFDSAQNRELGIAVALATYFRYQILSGSADVLVPVRLEPLGQESRNGLSASAVAIAASDCVNDLTQHLDALYPAPLRNAFGHIVHDRTRREFASHLVGAALEQ